MEENYRAINLELVLKNQDLKETISILKNELIKIKEEQLIIKQQNSKLLNEIEKSTYIKNEISKYMVNIGKITDLIFKLIYPEICENNENEISGQNVTLNLINQNNIISQSYKNKSDSANNSPHMSYVNEKRRRRSPALRRSSCNEIISSPTRKSQRFNKSSEEIEIHQQESGMENNPSLVPPEQQIPQRLSMTTILETDEHSKNFHSEISAKSKSNSDTLKNSNRKRSNAQINENFDIVETSSSSSTLQKSPKTMISNIPVVNIDNVPVDNLTISNVPCSTPYQIKKCPSDLCSDDDKYSNLLNESSAKIPKVLLKRLTLEELPNQFQMKIESDTDDEVNTKILRSRRKKSGKKKSIEEKTQKEEKPFNKTKKSKNRNTRSRKLQDDDDDNNKENTNDESNNLHSINTKRSLRSRKNDLCFAESNLKYKLRR